MEVRKENPGVFFPWPGEPQGSENGITLRVPTAEVIQEWDEQTTEERDVIIDGQLFSKRVVTDQKKRDMLRYDYCIADWCGLTENGDEVPCTPENKYNYMKKSPEFSAFVGMKIKKLNQLIEQRAEAERKN